MGRHIFLGVIAIGLIILALVSSDDDGGFVPWPHVTTNHFSSRYNYMDRISRDEDLAAGSSTSFTTANSSATTAPTATTVAARWRAGLSSYNITTDELTLDESARFHITAPAATDNLMQLYALKEGMYVNFENRSRGEPRRGPHYIRLYRKQIHLFSAEEALDCIHGKTILFMGDPSVKQLFLGLSDIILNRPVNIEALNYGTLERQVREASRDLRLFSERFKLFRIQFVFEHCSVAGRLNCYTESIAKSIPSKYVPDSIVMGVHFNNHLLHSIPPTRRVEPLVSRNSTLEGFVNSKNGTAAEMASHSPDGNISHGREDPAPDGVNKPPQLRRRMIDSISMRREKQYIASLAANLERHGLSRLRPELIHNHLMDISEFISIHSHLPITWVTAPSGVTSNSTVLYRRRFNYQQASQTSPRGERAFKHAASKTQSILRETASTLQANFLIRRQLNSPAERSDSMDAAASRKEEPVFRMEETSNEVVEAAGARRVKVTNPIPSVKALNDVMIKFLVRYVALTGQGFELVDNRINKDLWGNDQIAVSFKADNNDDRGVNQTLESDFAENNEGENENEVSNKSSSTTRLSYAVKTAPSKPTLLPVLDIFTLTNDCAEISGWDNCTTFAIIDHPMWIINSRFVNRMKAQWYLNHICKDPTLAEGE